MEGNYCEPFNNGIITSELSGQQQYKTLITEEGKKHSEGINNRLGLKVCIVMISSIWDKQVVSAVGLINWYRE